MAGHISDDDIAAAWLAHSVAHSSNFIDVLDTDTSLFDFWGRSFIRTAPLVVFSYALALIGICSLKYFWISLGIQAACAGMATIKGLSELEKGNHSKRQARIAALKSERDMLKKNRREI